GCPDQAGEGPRVAHGQVGQYLPVEVQARGSQPVDEGGVTHTLGAGRRADPRDPQPAELPLAVAAVPVGVDPGMHDLFFGHAIPAGSRPDVAPGLGHDLPALLPSVDAALDSWHGLWWRVSGPGCAGSRASRR